MVESYNDKSDEECVVILQRIFAGNEVLLTSIAPDGWEHSQYVHFFHPTPGQQLEEHEKISGNLARLTKRANEAADEMQKKALSDFPMDNLKNIRVRDEFLQVLGKTIWDVFSDNHEVIAEDGKIYDFGSFRGSGDTIAAFMNEYYPATGKLDYLDFYMGSTWISGRASLLPFYRHIFMVLKQHNCNWRYSFPKLGLVNFNNCAPDENSNPAEYTPWRALQEELSNEKSENKLQDELDRIYEEEYENAKYKPLPLTVLAYKEVYGVLPEGHPQKEFE